MAKDDYFVIVYKILSYLYSCLKKGEIPDENILKHDSSYLNINETYWLYIIEHLIYDKYIDGMTFKKSLDGFVTINGLKYMRITPRGIGYLFDESKLNKAKEFLKDIKAMVPFI